MATQPTLTEALGRYRVAYLLTVSDAAAPHAVAVTARLVRGSDAHRLEVTGHGKRSVANAAARPRVTVLWPASEPGGHALIVDGRAEAAGEALRIAITRAVLHRSNDGDPRPPEQGCAANCVELVFTNE